MSEPNDKNAIKTAETTTPANTGTPDRKQDFTARIKSTKNTRWLRFGIVSLIFFLWVLWLGNPWVLLVYPLDRKSVV